MTGSPFSTATPLSSGALSARCIISAFFCTLTFGRSSSESSSAMSRENQVEQEQDHKINQYIANKN